MKNESFKLGDLLVERELQHPYFWIVKRNSVVIDRDQYSNDIRERFDIGVYNDSRTKVEDIMDDTKIAVIGSGLDAISVTQPKINRWYTKDELTNREKLISSIEGWIGPTDELVYLKTETLGKLSKMGLPACAG
jgi:hypothetical protein